MPLENKNYVVVKATFADGETEATYEELHPNPNHSALIPQLGNRDAAPRNFIELSEYLTLAVLCPPTADIAAAVDYLAIETSIFPAAAAPNWVQAVDTALADIQVASVATYADKAVVINADTAALGPIRLAFYTALDALVSPADGGDSVWYVIMKRSNQ